MNRGTRQWVARRRWMLATVVTVGMFGLLELGARLVPVEDEVSNLGAPIDNPALMRPDRDRIWRLDPGRYKTTGVDVTIDEDGFRVPASAGEGPLVLTVGDSSIFGYGVPDGQTLHDRLQVELAEAGVTARVATVAVPGYSTVQSLAALEDGWERAPALLVVGNLWSDTTFDQTTDLDRLAAAGGTWRDRSAFYRVIRSIVRRASGKATANQVAWPEGERRLGVRRVAIGDYVANLVRMMDEARGREVGVVFLTLTNAHQLAKGERADTDWAPYRDAQRLVAQAVGAVAVDAQQVFTASGRTKPELLMDELHPTPLGDALLADALAATLLGAGWPAAKLVPGPTGAVAVPVDDRTAVRAQRH